MITIKSTKYNVHDAMFVADVLDRGLCGCCEKYSSYYNPHDIICDGCVNKTACSDLQSAYHYMIAKVFRDFAEDQSIKVDPLELELLDS